MVAKASFLKLAAALDAKRLRADYASIPAEAWQPSYWSGPHGSVEALLLRGGTTDSAGDYCTTAVRDRPVLAELPYLAELVGPDGPFGQAFFAFVFRMLPDGISRLHRDAHPIWYDMYRVHVPLETCPGARLVVEGRRAQHLDVGEAWTFDNQSLHGVLNGARQRAHLILDVPASNEPVRALVERAEHVEGEPITEAEWERLGGAEVQA